MSIAGQATKGLLSKLGLKPKVQTGTGKTGPLGGPSKKTTTPLVGVKSTESSKPILNPRLVRDLDTDELVESPPLEQLGEFYSPLKSTIEQMPIAKKGSKGKHISAFLNKRSPNVTQSEKNFANIHNELDPETKYTRKELLNKTKEKGTDVYDVRVRKQTQNQVEFSGLQRLPNLDLEKDYYEITVHTKKLSDEIDQEEIGVHFPDNTILHNRVSLRERKDGSLYLFGEESQSDLARMAGPQDTMKEVFDYGAMSKKIDENILPKNSEKIRSVNLKKTLGTFKAPPLMDRIKKYYDGVHNLINNARKNGLSEEKINDIVTNERDRLESEGLNFYYKLIKKEYPHIKPPLDGRSRTSALALMVQQDIAARHGIPVDDGAFGLFNASRRYEGKFPNVDGKTVEWNPDGIGYFLMQLDTSAFAGLDKTTAIKEYYPLSAVPINTRVELMVKSIQANIMLAKRLGVDEIVLPPAEQIAKLRGEQYTEAFDKLYNDATKKALNIIKTETKGKIKIGEEVLEYRPVDEMGRYIDPEEVAQIDNFTLYSRDTDNFGDPYTSDKISHIKINIKDLDFNPETEAMRFDEGGLSPVKEKMKPFEWGKVSEEPVGEPTNKVTNVGRIIYKTKDGEDVSERGLSIDMGDGSWANSPSIWGDSEYSEDAIREAILAGVIEPTSIHTTQKEAVTASKKRSANLQHFNKGGVMIGQQMELFQDGGLRDEGGQIDPMSGNQVPSGALANEVSDDVPAQISEGEFIFPADVVRYIGLEKLMQMRQEAKQGLKMMEDMGQMGNSDEATMPDDVPFDMSDLDIGEASAESSMESPIPFSKGGVVKMQTGGGLFDDPRFKNQTQSQSPVMSDDDKKEIENALLGTAYGNIVMKRYVDADGNVKYIPHIDGKPQMAIPEGYELDTSAPTPENSGANIVRSSDSGGGGGSSTSPITENVIDPFTAYVSPENRPKDYGYQGSDTFDINALDTDALIQYYGSFSSPMNRFMSVGVGMLFGGVPALGIAAMQQAAQTRGPNSLRATEEKLAELIKAGKLSPSQLKQLREFQKRAKEKGTGPRSFISNLINKASGGDENKKNVLTNALNAGDGKTIIKETPPLSPEELTDVAQFFGDDIDINEPEANNIPQSVWSTTTMQSEDAIDSDFMDVDTDTDPSPFAAPSYQVGDDFFGEQQQFGLGPLGNRERQAAEKQKRFLAANEPLGERKITDAKDFLAKRADEMAMSNREKKFGDIPKKPTKKRTRRATPVATTPAEPKTDTLFGQTFLDDFLQGKQRDDKGNVTNLTQAQQDAIDRNTQQVRERTQKAYSDPMKTIAERERDIHGGSTPSSDFWSGAAGGNWSASKGGLAKSKAKPKRMKKGGLASKKKK